MNLDLEADLQRWEAGAVSLDEIGARHPGQDVVAIADLHRRFALLGREDVPDPAPSWELLAARLPVQGSDVLRIDEPGRGRRSERTRRSHRARRRLAVLGLAAVLTLTSGLAAAGALPAPAQNAVSAFASHLGIDLPRAPDSASHGAEVSDVAHSTSVEGCEKGQAVAGVASTPSLEHRQDALDKPDPCANAGADGPSGAGGAPEGPPSEAGSASSTDGHGQGASTHGHSGAPPGPAAGHGSAGDPGSASGR